MNDTCPERLDDGGDTNHCYHNSIDEDDEEELLVCCFCGLVFISDTNYPKGSEHGPNDPAKQGVPKFQELSDTQLRVMKSLPKLKDEYKQLRQHHIRETKILWAKLKEARKK